MGVDFSSQNGNLRGELKKVFSIEEVEKFNKISNISKKQAAKPYQQTLKIYTDENFSKMNLQNLNGLRVIIKSRL